MVTFDGKGGADLKIASHASSGSETKVCVVILLIFGEPAVRPKKKPCFFFTKGPVHKENRAVLKTPGGWCKKHRGISVGEALSSVL